MATATLQKTTVAIKLNNGTDDRGNTKYVSVSLGDLSEEYFANHKDDAMTKVLAVVTALEDIFSKPISSVNMTEVSTLTAA